MIERPVDQISAYEFRAVQRNVLTCGAVVENMEQQLKGLVDEVRKLHQEVERLRSMVRSVVAP